MQGMQLPVRREEGRHAYLKTADNGKTQASLLGILLQLKARMATPQKRQKEVGRQVFLYLISYLFTIKGKKGNYLMLRRDSAVVCCISR
jgi:hypothetical protein